MRHRNSTHSNVMQVPEISGASKPKLDASVLTALVKRAQASLGKQAAVPMIIGPITMARLATLTDTDVPAVVKKLTPLYTQLLKELSGLGVRILSHLQWRQEFLMCACRRNQFYLIACNLLVNLV